MAKDALEIAEDFYSRGDLRAALEALAASQEVSLPCRMLRAVIGFDMGEASSALASLEELCSDNAGAPLPERLSQQFALFSRLAPFSTPGETATHLAKLRQLSTAIGDGNSIAKLHVAVAKVETLKGAIDDAQTHLDIAKRICENQHLDKLAGSVALLDASVAASYGDLRGAAHRTGEQVKLARLADRGMPLIGLLGNYGQLSLWTGQLQAASHFLDEALARVGDFSFLRLGVLDSLAALRCRQGNLAEAAKLIDACQQTIKSQTVPSRSWYDLTHQITRCLYHSRTGEWDAIVRIVDDADAELERRQLRTWRASLLAARAKAFARLGEHDRANASLVRAMQVCPRGAVDPMIHVETATAVCLAERGEHAQADRHFARATRACDAIEHRFLGWIVEHERQTSAPVTHAPRTEPERRRRSDTDDTALILGDAAAILNAGHSVALLAERVRSILHATPLRTRVTMTSRAGGHDQPHLSATWDFHGSQGCHINLIAADRTITFDIRDLATLEEVSLLKSLTDLLGASVNRDDEANERLWPMHELPSPDDTVFWSPRMQELLRIAERLASTDLPILITGETGTGKEVFARLIHDHSKVRRGPFIPFNASAIPRELVESQLFGHRRGSFTGAHDSAPGVIRSADKGTLFLDEIGDLELTIQPKLLRFLEAGEVHPVGETKPLNVSVRVVAATNARLDVMVEQGRFRSDLLYRLRVAALALPPLRERKDEIPALTAFFVRKAMVECGRKDIAVGDDLVAALLLYDWPGNLRQLFNELRRMVAMAEDGSTLHSDHLSPDIAGPWRSAHPRENTATGPHVTVRLDQPLDLAVHDVERAFIERAMAQTRGRVADAAQLLGISRKGLFVKRKRLGLD